MHPSEAKSYLKDMTFSHDALLCGKHGKKVVKVGLAVLHCTLVKLNERKSRKHIFILIMTSIVLQQNQSFRDNSLCRLYRNLENRVTIFYHPDDDILPAVIYVYFCHDSLKRMAAVLDMHFSQWRIGRVKGFETVSENYSGIVKR